MNNSEATVKCKERILYFDYLRVFAICAVIVLHISAHNWYSTDVNSFDWQVFNFFDSIVRWGVPAFVMISGALFLGREIPTKVIWSKYVKKMAVAFIIWTVIYALFTDKSSLTNLVIVLIQGHYHMWFIPMIAGLYICIPLIKPVVGDESRIKYYLLIAFVFAFAFPTFVVLANDFAEEHLRLAINAINHDVGNMYMHFVLGYLSYFVLGFYLNRITLKKSHRIIIYFLGLAGFASTIFLDSYVALKTQEACNNYYGYFSLNVLMESVAVFTFFKYVQFNNDKINRFIKRLSDYSFGVFLVHALVIELLDRLTGLNTLSFNPIMSVLCISVIVSVISFSISALLNHIPFIKKYIV